MTSLSTTARNTPRQREVLFGLCTAIGNITRISDDGKRLFSTPQLTSFFVDALQKCATMPESIQDICYAVVSICSCCYNSIGLKLFATTEFIATLKNAEEYATDSSSKNELDKCLELLEDFLTQNSQHTHEIDNDQSGGAVAFSSSSATIHLQKELAEALQKIAVLSSQLHQEKQKSSDLENELQKLKEQNQK
jgi:hypothetical protein